MKYNYIFDIGGVLIKYDSEAVIESFSERFKCDGEVIRPLFSHELLYQAETGRMKPDTFFTDHVKKVLPDISFEEWLAAFVDYFELNQPGYELLLKLKNRGERVFILSNLAEFHKVALERKVPGFFDICEKNFLSYELGYHKPEREIYEKVCAEIGAAPETCMFFDDMQKNVEGACDFGIRALRFANENKEALYKAALDGINE